MRPALEGKITQRPRHGQLSVDPAILHPAAQGFNPFPLQGDAVTRGCGGRRRVHKRLTRTQSRAYGSGPEALPWHMIRAVESHFARGGEQRARITQVGHEDMITLHNGARHCASTPLRLEAGISAQACIKVLKARRERLGRPRKALVG